MIDRIVSLPHPVDREGVEAKYQDGILRVVMPKREQIGKNKVKVQVQ